MDRTAKKLLVAVTTELTGKGANLVAKGKEGGLNVLVLKGFNSLTPMDGHDRPYFNELRARVVSPRIFVRC